MRRLSLENAPTQHVIQLTGIPMESADTPRFQISATIPTRARGSLATNSVIGWCAIREGVNRRFHVAFMHDEFLSVTCESQKRRSARGRELHRWGRGAHASWRGSASCRDFHAAAKRRRCRARTSGREPNGHAKGSSPFPSARSPVSNCVVPVEEKVASEGAKVESAIRNRNVVNEDGFLAVHLVRGRRHLRERLAIRANEPPAARPAGMGVLSRGWLEVRMIKPRVIV